MKSSWKFLSQLTSTPSWLMNQLTLHPHIVCAVCSQWSCEHKIFFLTCRVTAKLYGQTFSVETRRKFAAWQRTAVALWGEIRGYNTYEADKSYSFHGTPFGACLWPGWWQWPLLEALLRHDQCNLQIQWEIRHYRTAWLLVLRPVVRKCHTLCNL